MSDAHPIPSRGPVPLCAKCRVEAETVACASCGARAGRPCVTKWGAPFKFPGVHKARWLARPPAQNH